MRITAPDFLQMWLHQYHDATRLPLAELPVEQNPFNTRHQDHLSEAMKMAGLAFVTMLMVSVCVFVGTRGLIVTG